MSEWDEAAGAAVEADGLADETEEPSSDTEGVEELSDFEETLLVFRPRMGAPRGSTIMHKIIDQNPMVGQEAHNRLASGHTLASVAAFLSRFGFSVSMNQMAYYTQEYIPPAQRFSVPRLTPKFEDWSPRVDTLEMMGEAIVLQAMRIQEMRKQELAFRTNIPAMESAIELLVMMLGKYAEHGRSLGFEPLPEQRIALSGGVSQVHSGEIGFAGTVTHVEPDAEGLEDFRRIFETGLRATAEANEQPNVEAAEARVETDSDEGA